MSASRSVLVTGSAGTIGRAVCSELIACGHHVRRLDRLPTPHVDGSVVCDLLEPAQIRSALEGIDTVVHLAATPGEADFMTKLLPNNIIAVYQLLDAARDAGIRNVILTSSTQVNMADMQHLPYTTDMLLRPRNWYSVTKAFGEAAGRMCSDVHGMNVLIVRPGGCPWDKAQLSVFENSAFNKNIYLSARDAGRFYACAVAAIERIRFAILYATSKPYKETVSDINAAAELIGYLPEDIWPQGTELLE